MLNLDQSKNKFRQIVENKYQIYNSLFMSLPYDKMLNIGSLIPFLYEESKTAFPEGTSPIEIIDNFFDKYTDIHDELERIDLLFRFIQYIERQVVLFDSIEDASFPSLNPPGGKGSLESVYQVALQQRKLPDVKDRINNFSARIVFTAHPTQFYPYNVLRIIHDLRSAIQTDSVSKIDMLLQQLGKTPFTNEQKPTPYDEALSIIYYMRYVYYDAIGELYEQVKDTFFGRYEEMKSPIIQLGFWPGGDRDGNPYVTADITKKVANELRVSILKCYYNDLKEVRRRLTFKFITEPLAKIHERIYNEMLKDEGTLTIEELMYAMNRIRTILIERHNGLFLNVLDSFIFKLKLFGLHFATLDIRQDSRIHTKVVSDVVLQVTGKEFDKLSDQEKIDVLTKTKFNIDPEDYEDEITRETLQNVAQLKYIQSQNGELGVNRYIISNSEDIFDVLNVYGLFKFCGYKDEEIKFDIIPLFETIRGLDGAEKTMQTLYNLPEYSSHLERRGKNQTIMLGFSDGTKDGGYIKANWEIYHTKEVLTKVSRENDINVIFFDGRGGPPARGGGKTHQFYASQGQTIADNKIELTIQGQTITSNFGTGRQAKHNFEQFFTAGILSNVFENERTNISEENRKIIDDLANVSYKKYADLKAHPMFVPYLANRSTLNYYGRANIGSRPSKRGNKNELNFDDLRAIPFVGSWSQLKQNVPGYYGVGTAIKKYKDAGRIDEVKALFNDSAFFKTLIQNSMMAMEKTYFPLTQYMKDDPDYSEFWNLLHDEFVLSRDMTLEISGYSALMEQEPINKASIMMREKIVLPLLTIQQYALEKIYQKSPHIEAYERMVTRSLFGNINASRNSA